MIAVPHPQYVLRCYGRHSFGTTRGTLLREAAHQEETNAMWTASKIAATMVVASSSLVVVHCEESSIMPFPEDCIVTDTYNGVSIDISTLPEHLIQDEILFGEHLSKAIEIWKQQDKRGVWLTVPTTHSHFIPIATKLDFDFQYAEKGKVILTTWLPSTPSRLPFGPTHQIGVGALVLHPISGKMLVVQEKSGPAAARKLWKMPTGLADPGEDILDAVVREVKEETGLDCIFDQILCFRQAHYSRKSDMFFVCQLTVAPRYLQELQEEGKEIELCPQEEEIAHAKWVDVDEYFSQPLWLSSPLYTKMNEALQEAARNIHPAATETDERTDTISGYGFVGKRLPIGFNPGHNTFYFVRKNE